MSEPHEGLEPLEPTGPDQVFDFDVKVIPDQAGIDAVIAWAKAKAKANDAKAAENGEAQKRDDPDRPAA
jgi:hypothetical protein